MTAIDALRPFVAEIPAIDHHAHVLADAHAPLRLAAVLTESHDRRQIDAVTEHPAYLWAQRELAGVLGVEPSEEALANLRRSDPSGYVARLLQACRLAAMFVDDGFRPPGALTLDEHRALVGCPVRRIVRVESEAEAACAGWPPLSEVRARLGRAVASAMADGAAGLKTIAAYRCGLDLPPPSTETAEPAYERWRRSETTRLSDPALVSLFLADALDAAGTGVPLQVHTGLGDGDQLLAQADPALLQPHVDSGFLAGRPIMLLHCYPFIRQAGYLAGIYSDVHLDLSLATTLMPHRGAHLVLEALELAPVTKLLFATDASRLPEMFLLGTRSWRDALARALGSLIDDGPLDESRAQRWAELILAGNARRVYGFDGV